MNNWMKALVGLAVSLAAAWIYTGPLGHGAALIDGIEARAKIAVARTAVPGISVTLGHDPLSRFATLSGPADAFQREGQGELKGISDIVAEVDGVSGIRWTDETEGRGMSIPLLAEIFAWTIAAYLAGLILGWIFFRPRREGFY